MKTAAHHIPRINPISCFLLICPLLLLPACYTALKKPDSRPPVLETPPPTGSEKTEPAESPPAPPGSAVAPPVFSRAVVRIADSLAALHLMYDSRPATLRDCSGIFHRTVQALREAFPKQGFPAIRTARSSRTIAKWYQQHGRFRVITDPVKQSRLIELGAVLFFARRGVRLPHPTAQQVFRAIGHLGIVVAVGKNAAGEVVKYKLFHGRRPGKPASVTGWHLRNPRRRGLPPFGNWDQQWIGWARLLER